MPDKYNVGVTYDEDSGMWTLERELRVQSRGYTLVVPAGFRTDLASIPRALWSIIAPFQLSLAAPIVHDWLYENDGLIIAETPATPLMTRGVAQFDRLDADNFLEDLMEQEGVSAWRRWFTYHAVRLFGGKSWQSNPSSNQAQ